MTNASMQGTFQLTMGDIIAESVSLRNHVHICPACGATTSPPVGGGGGGSGNGSSASNTGGNIAGNNSSGDKANDLECEEIAILPDNPDETPPLSDFPAINKKLCKILIFFTLSDDEYINFENMRSVVADRGTDKDKLISCLPFISQYMADRESNNTDKYGWHLLTAFFYLWLSGMANNDAYNTSFAAFISWKWLMGYYRFRKIYDAISNPEILFNVNAQNLLAKRLKADRKFTDKVEEFDYIYPENNNYKIWFTKYFQSRPVPSQRLYSLIPDGLMASMASFMLRALAQGYVEPFGASTG